MATSSTSNTELETLKSKLAAATELCLIKTRQLCEVRDRQTSLINQHIESVKSETAFLNQAVEEMRSKLAKVRQQLSMIGICGVSEKLKHDGHLRCLEQHRRGFQAILDKEHAAFLLRMAETRDKLAAEEEKMVQEKIKLKEQNEQIAKEIEIVKAESDAVARECNVLQKRNHAMMLKLRRKLLETEKARRKLANKNDNSSDNILNNSNNNN